jgi:histidyl-tRNA synthetase
MSEQKIQAIRGMKDILPEEMVYWHFIEENFQKLVSSYGYQEIRTPIVESTSLFIRSIGAATDIVEKETYTFTDRNGDSLTLRPEATAGTVRAGIEHSLFYNQIQRLWYGGPIFRHERPQKGRYRQFYQLGVEAFGMTGPDIDIELLFLCWRWWQQLGIAHEVELQLNTLGLASERLAYRRVLTDYFRAHYEQLDEDSQRRLEKNPLRILDSKNPQLQALLAGAPTIYDHLGEASRLHFEQICLALTQAKIPYKVNPRLVRGLDYYCHTVFEWVSHSLGAQGTVCAGGRYDGLVEQMGGAAVPAVGFAMGIERLILLLQQSSQKTAKTPAIYIMSSPANRAAALLLAEQVRTAFPKLEVINHCGLGNLKSQLRRADKLSAQIGVILDEELSNSEQVVIKYLQSNQPQETVDSANAITQLQHIFEKEA